MEATKGPWRTNGGCNIVAPGYYDAIASCGTAGVNWAQADANAAHIVRCVNAHEALVRALTAIVESGWVDPEVSGGKVGYQLHASARAALALARGEGV